MLKIVFVNQNLKNYIKMWKKYFICYTIDIYFTKQERNEKIFMKKNKQENQEKTAKQKSKKDPIEKINQNENKIENNTNKSIFHQYLWYTLIFSILGLIVEIIFTLATKGKLENRSGLILGPLCIIYGLAVAAVIALLNRYKGHKIKLFIYGAILGTAIEYLTSFVLEAVWGIRFWNYSWTKFNICGRICLQYTILWGILTLIIIEVVKKYLDKLINKIQGKPGKIVDIIITTLIIIETIFTIWGITVYSVRAKETLNGKNYISNNNVIEKFQNTVFSNDIMEKIFPNLQIIDNDGNEILVINIFNK